MADCTKSSKQIAEDEVEMEHEEEQEAPSPSSLSKRTKFTSQELKELENLPPTPPTLLQNDAISVVSPVKTSLSSDYFSVSDDFSSSRCSSNDSRAMLNSILKSADLEEATSFETEVSTCNINNTNNKFRFSSRDSSPLSEICGDSEQASMDSPLKKPPPFRRSKSSPEAATKMPSMAEMDEFFSAAEKYEQKRFAEKYNYDVVNDVPLEGRYQWVRLN